VLYSLYRYDPSTSDSERLARDLSEPSHSISHPRLLVGSLAAASAEQLRLRGVTHVVNCMGPVEAQAAEALGCVVRTLSLRDTDQQVLDFAATCAFIDRALRDTDFCVPAVDPEVTTGEEDNVVLVYCATGVSLSPALVVAYLMHSQRLTMERAITTARAHRCQTFPRMNFLVQLRQWQDTLHIMSTEEAAAVEAAAHEIHVAANAYDDGYGYDDPQSGGSWCVTV
jgi:protein-tyrosine phosphatase